MKINSTQPMLIFIIIIICKISISVSYVANEELCGLGTANDYSPWISDEFGRLAFPVFNQDVYGVEKSVAVRDVCPSTLAERLTAGYATTINDTCQYEFVQKKWICKGNIDFDVINKFSNLAAKSFVVDGYNVNAKSLTTPQRNPKDRTLSNSVQILMGADSYKLTGNVFSNEIGIGIRVAVNLDKYDESDYLVSGDVFSNELRVGWRISGTLQTFKRLGYRFQTYLNTSDSDGGWYLDGNCSQIWPSSDIFTISGQVTLPIFASGKLTFNGFFKSTAIDESLEEITAEGNVVVGSIMNVWIIEASLAERRPTVATILPNAFSKLEIEHFFFKDCNFLGDFDEDALQEIRGLKTISFLDSKLEEFPRLDVLFSNMNDLEALYIEQTSMPNLMLGTTATLPNLQLLSFKGSGPLLLDDYSFKWLSNSNLTYLNLQDCNIKLSSSDGGVLVPVRETLKYLDLSHTSLTDEKSLTKILKQLAITHLSLAGLHLSKVPRQALEMVNTIQYLTLRGNSFRKVPEENMLLPILDFPEMPEVVELDLQRCDINFIEKGAFNMFPKLKKLYLSYNNIENFQEGWVEFTPGVTHIDLSWNGVVPEPMSYLNIQSANGVTALSNLETIDLSYGVFDNPEQLVASLPSSILGISLCNINLRNSSAFSQIQAKNLITFDVSSNPYIEFGNQEIIGFFYSLNALRYLYARNNKITNTLLTAIEDFMDTVESDYLIETLEVLDLKGNNIKSLTGNSFKYFPNLRSIDLTSNSIVTWSESPLMHNPNLFSLKISDNKIERMNEVMLSDIYKLDEIEMSRNPFMCDCTLKTLAHKLNVNNGSMCSNDTKEVKPSSGYRGYFIFNAKHVRKKRRILDHSHSVKELMRVQNLMEHNPTRKCLPSVQTSKPKIVEDSCVVVTDWVDETNYYCYVESYEIRMMKNLDELDLCAVPASEGFDDDSQDMLVLCIVITVVIVLAMLMSIIYWKWWDIRLLTKAVRNAAILSFLDKDIDEPEVTYQYSAFVSYCDKDRPWVLQRLLPTLDAWNELTICLHERDFQVGVSIMENITSCMDRSRNIVLILSQSFMRSQWCQFELHLAQHRLIETRRDQLILILLEPIPRHKRPKTLRYLMRTKTYIEWPSDSKNEDKVAHFWARLFRALSTTHDPILLA